VESSDDAIISNTLDGTITSWNPAAQRLLGYCPEEVIGRPISILAAPDRENEMAANLERIRRGERVERYDTVRRRKDGSLVDLSLTVSPIRDATVASSVLPRSRATSPRESTLKNASDC
jgi:PAS domain S-box-containing protein